MKSIRTAKNVVKSILFRYPQSISLLYPRVDLCYPLDGVKGHFPKSFSRKPPEIHVTNQVLEYIRPNHVCFDVGANIGFYSLLFAKYGGKVISFEPVTMNFAVLRRNLDMNRVGKKVLFYRKAVGSGGGQSRFISNSRALTFVQVFSTNQASMRELTKFAWMTFVVKTQFGRRSARLMLRAMRQRL